MSFPDPYDTSVATDQLPPAVQVPPPPIPALPPSPAPAAGAPAPSPVTPQEAGFRAAVHSALPATPDGSGGSAEDVYTRPAPPAPAQPPGPPLSAGGGPSAEEVYPGEIERQRALPPTPVSKGGGPSAEDIYAPPPGTETSPNIEQGEVDYRLPIKGARGGVAITGEDHPFHEPRLQMPIDRYKQLEKEQPALYKMVNTVAEQVGVPKLDLAALVYANSENNPAARDGARTGYMGLTPDDARQYDPEGHMDINNPVQNLYLGALKYKQLAAQFGKGDPNAFAAYYAGPDAVNNLMTRSAEEQRLGAPAGMFDFLNKVAGREPSTSTESPDITTGGTPRRDEVTAEPGQPRTAMQQERAQPPGFWERLGAGYTSTDIPKPGEAPTPMGQTPTVPQATVDPDTGQVVAAPGGGKPQAVIPPPTTAAAIPPAPAAAAPAAAPGAPGPMPQVPAAPPAAIGAPGATAPAAPAPAAALGAVGPGPAPPPVPPAPAAPSMSGPPAATAPPGVTPPDHVLAQPNSPTTGAQTPHPDIVLGDSYAGGAGQAAGVPSISRVGIPTSEVLKIVQSTPPDQTRGKNVMLSTGLVNGGSTGDVQQMIAYLLDPQRGGATSVTLMGAPANARFNSLNGALAGIASQSKGGSVQFLGPVTNIAADGVHPANYGAYISGGQGPANVTTPVVGTAAAPGPTPSRAALGPPGSRPDQPITQLSGSPGAITAPGLIRAYGSGGPDGVLTYMSYNAPRGMTVGNSWDHVGNLLAQAFVARGDMQGVMHAQEYVFQMQHAGAIQNLQSAYNAYQSGDLQGAAQLLARSHAFANDGAAIGFQVLNGQLYGQRYGEADHQPLGQPFVVNAEGIRNLANIQRDPFKFQQTVDAARKTNEEIAHNRQMEVHGEEEIQAQRETAQSRIEAARANLQSAQELTRQMEASREAAAMERVQARTAAANAARDAAAAQVKQSVYTNTGKEIDNIYGPLAQGDQAPLDAYGQPMSADMRNTAAQTYAAIRNNNQQIPSGMAQDWTKNLLAGQYRYRPTTGGYTAVVNNKGRPLVYIPSTDLRGLIPESGVPAPGARPTQTAPVH